ncbi:Uncharacterized protein APZ42_033921 [Daphnia magna]|uniref:Reverse transcriptase domain-containing protein n=1 Tax=Daphnia magna TaxID=35525 RepID=A0A164KLE5_9CRUS|nr:Uncharacterized protein APZ42_033921 [Daphnia magna]
MKKLILHLIDNHWVAQLESLCSTLFKNSDLNQVPQAKSSWNGTRLNELDKFYSDVLHQFISTQVPQLRHVFKLILTLGHGNAAVESGFSVNKDLLVKESIRIFRIAGVRQGDALSSPIFNLASEPLVRTGISNINPGFLLFGSLVKTTAFADDIAVVTNSPSELQNILNVFSLTANTLGLQFNAGKCACLVFDKGKPSDAELVIN